MASYRHPTGQKVKEIERNVIWQRSGAVRFPPTTTTTLLVKFLLLGRKPVPWNTSHIYGENEKIGKKDVRRDTRCL